jgi:hypothetical protein
MWAMPTLQLLSLSIHYEPTYSVGIFVDVDGDGVRAAIVVITSNNSFGKLAAREVCNFKI